MSETLWAISADCEQPLPQYIAGCFHPRWKELRAEHDALERELTAALAKAAHMERALDAVCKHCWSLADGPYIKAWALKKAEDAK